MRFKLVLFVILCLLCCSGCKENIDNVTLANYYEVRSYLEKDDGWTYYLTITYDKNGNIKYYNFNGINRKPDAIDDLYMPVEEDGKEIERLEPMCICLNYYQTYKEEFERINNFLNEKLYSRKITESDLNELKLNFYSKDDIVILVNNALNLEYKRPIGKFKYSLNTLKKKDQLGEWSIITEGSYGYIEKVYINYKDKNGRYLSDLIEESDLYDDIYSDIKRIEDYIIEKQDVKNIEKYIKNVNNDMYQTLFEMISTIEE